MDLQPLVKIKTARLAIKLLLGQNSKEQENPTKKRTKWCVLKLVHLIGESWNRFHAEISKNARIIEGSGMLKLIKKAA